MKKLILLFSILSLSILSTSAQTSDSDTLSKDTALELKSLGINLSWSPVADIFSNPQNPIIGPRAFGNTPQTASEGAREYYRGLREEGILGSAKHFPGHGDTSTDSHLELPILNLSREDLRNRELIPFQTLIQDKIPLIMTAHILFPQIDPEVPATLSKIILKLVKKEDQRLQSVFNIDASRGNYATKIEDCWFNDKSGLQLKKYTLEMVINYMRNVLDKFRIKLVKIRAENIKKPTIDKSDYLMKYQSLLLELNAYLSDSNTHKKIILYMCPELRIEQKILESLTK
jgi:hypothetical protein